MDKVEQFTKKYFALPENRDKYEQRLQRYTLADVEDVAEQFADKQLTEYRDKLREVLEVTGTITKEDIEIAFLTTTTNNDE